MSHRDIWMVGDLQGCCRSLEALMRHPDITAGDDPRFWFAGDLVNRGPDSLRTLRSVIALGDRAVSVLGNHDLHLLGIAAGLRKVGKSDTFDEILNAPDAEALLDWIRHCPLAHYEHGHLMVHAGVLPQWSVADTLELAAEVQKDLRAPDWRQRLQTMYGNEPSQWRDDLDQEGRRRIVINALTRLRMCDAQGRMEFRHKLAPTEQDWNDSGLLPWYDAPGRRTRDEATIVFGHWSTLGLLMRPDVICLDTGCVWGRSLTAVRLGDRKVVQVDCTDQAGADC
ncbi:symmetrical bis(5'-nucleosyl)-tetraphosphatase [Pusillimonas noertemannii]|uniref:symmetrical bis(5'-nucleosyl)-tetraphosphatase n=1 Tax=Pusillimonas noertemannii TaxID=305977 RepID=UPI0003138A96|nr:symmetrical bis(5'-nucleosyl)-tetraphosphatase [Pusillimonas noertemannii]